MAPVELMAQVLSGIAARAVGPVPDEADRATTARQRCSTMPPLRSAEEGEPAMARGPWRWDRFARLADPLKWCTPRSATQGLPRRSQVCRCGPPQLGANVLCEPRHLLLRTVRFRISAHQHAIVKSGPVAAGAGRKCRSSAGHRNRGGEATRPECRRPRRSEERRVGKECPV